MSIDRHGESSDCNRGSRLGRLSVDPAPWRQERERLFCFRTFASAFCVRASHELLEKAGLGDFFRTRSRIVHSSAHECPRCRFMHIFSTYQASDVRRSLVLTERRIRRHHHLGTPDPAHAWLPRRWLLEGRWPYTDAGRTIAMDIVWTWPPYPS